MKLLTKQDTEQLIRNGRASSVIEGGIDHKPVVKLFTPDANCTWLLSELDEDNPDLAWGLCDLGLGFPETGHVLISEIEGVRGKLGLPIERDRGFTADKTLSEYATIARKNECIIA